MNPQDSIFETYTIQSAAPNNTINLELPIAPLHRALRSAFSASSASLRLTKKDNIPLLSLTIVTNTIHGGSATGGFGISHASAEPEAGGDGDRSTAMAGGGPDYSVRDRDRDRETIVTQDVPVRVLSAAQVEHLHQPHCRDPDVHILLPSLLQLKSISERFTKLASSTSTSASSNAGFGGGAGSGLSSSGPKLELSANAQGSLRLRIATDALNITSVWTGLHNPELDPAQVEGGEEGVRNHPSTHMKQQGYRAGTDPDVEGSEAAWAKVRIDGKDWGRVLSVGRMGGKVIACFVHDLALILYVYLSNSDDHDDGRGGGGSDLLGGGGGSDGGDESCLTYYISSYSA